jgi:hypothetical protein
VKERLKSVFAYIKGAFVGVMNENINVIFALIYNQQGSEKGLKWCGF